jgi:hypothetical protein
MPEIRRFGGFRLLMFFRDENPPHVHIEGADFEAEVRIADGFLLAGGAPPRVLKRARAWIEDNRTELLEQWNRFKNE